MNPGSRHDDHKGGGRHSPLEALRDRLRRPSGQHRLDGMAARDVSYAYSVRSPAGKLVVRSLENLTGRPQLIHMARGYEHEVAEGKNFWAVMQQRFGIRLELDPADLAHIPTTGPVVVVANHPFGIMDGLLMGRILSMVRSDFRILAHGVFHKARDLHKVVLPINFDGTREALATNLQTRKTALEYLELGGCIGVFPGGTVSTGNRPFAYATDPAWKTFTAKMIQRTDAAVVPLLFEGQNSRLFQLASHLHPTLRVGLLIREFKRAIAAPVKVHIGEPLPREELAALRGDAKALMAHLWRRTYELSPTPVVQTGYGRSFD